MSDVSAETELAVAEWVVRTAADRGLVPDIGGALALVLAEYARNGTELERVTAENKRLRRDLSDANGQIAGYWRRHQQEWDRMHPPPLVAANQGLMAQVNAASMRHMGVNGACRECGTAYPCPTAKDLGAGA